MHASLVASSVMLLRGGSQWGGEHADVLVYTAEGQPEDVETEMKLVAEHLRDLGAPEPTALPDTGNALWAKWLGRTVAPEDFVIRVGVAPGTVIEWVQQAAPLLSRSELLVDLGNGQVFARGQLELERVRQRALAAGGYCVVIRAGTRVSSVGFDPWGYVSEADDLLRRIKAHWDPTGCLNPGVWTL